MSEEAVKTFSWKKFIKGVFDPLNTAKLAAFGLHIGLWVLIVFVGLFIFGKVKSYFTPTKAVAAPVTVTDNSGSIESGADKRDNKKIGLINF